MGTVYAVRDLSTDRRMALKCLQREAARENGPAAALFQREYHTLAHLRHPRVIQVFDYGVDAGRPYYTMELLDGSDLRELAPVPWKRACQLLRDVAFSLALLHSRRLLHRDLSPRNVRCTRDGRAKLLDFGTMAPMGIAKDVAGTPPYMAPEAVHGQVLDARTDLYALGALAYWTLTGFDAYPARDARELAQLWPRPILPPSAIATDVPEALDSLVMSLLGLDPQARPSHVAEVIERLTAIAGLPPADQLEMARAYLTSPTLIGHGDTLASFHKRLVRAARGRGSALLIRGAAGMGRSRVLQALVLEAKLSGIQVLAADAEDVQRGELGVMRALLDALILAAPDVALATFHPHAEVLGATFPALYDQLEYPPPLAPAATRSAQFTRSLQAMRDWLVIASQQRPLMIAVDDADHVDDGSAACLALLAGDTRAERIVVCATLESETSRKALELFAAEATRIDLVPLSAGQTARLLRSVFGEVPNLQVVAEWIHALSQGHPRTVMELSQYLVDHGIARFERGSWMLPETLRDAALPDSIEQAVGELLAGLSPPARALAQALALVTESGYLDLEEIVRLTGSQSPEQTFGAVDELLAAQVIAAVGRTHHVRHRGLSRALHDDLSPERKRMLHLRLANLYQTRTPRVDGGEQALLVAYHRRLGGDIQGCLDALRGERLPAAAAFGQTAEAASMYEACLAHGAAIGLPPARLYPLRKALLSLSATVDPALIQYAQATLVQLRHDCGLVYLDEHASEPDAVKRIRRCVAQALKTHADKPEAQRGLAPTEALSEVGVVILTLAESYVARQEAAPILELLALVEPLRPLSASLALVYDLTQQAHDGVCGKNVAAQRARTLAQLEQPVEGLDPISQHAIRCVLTYWLAMDEASAGKEVALDRAVLLESQSVYAPLGAQVRSIYHLFAGNETEAEAWRKRRELLALQLPANAGINSTPGIIYEAYGYYLCGSVLGMRRVLDAAGRLAGRHPGWKTWLRAIEGLYALLRGEPAAALPLLSDSDTMGRILALLQLGHVTEARMVADLAFERQPERTHPLYVLRVQAARALARSADGDRVRAAEQLDADIAQAESEGFAGMLLCVLHEARARIAVDLDDRTAFHLSLRKLGAIYGRGTAGLRARYEQLGMAARRALISLPPLPPPIGAEEGFAPQSTTVTSQIGLLDTRGQRCDRALRLLADHMRSTRGYLFGMQEAGLRLCASLGDGPAPEGMEDMLAFYLNAELDATEAVPRSVTGTFSAAPDMVAWINDGQHLYYPVLLSCIVGQRRVISGVAALAFAVQREPILPADLVAEISQALLASGDVVGADAAR
jgi:hypothetical protein